MVFLSGFDNLRDDSYFPPKNGGCTEVSYPPTYHLSKGKKTANQKITGGTLLKNTSKQLRFWRQQHFCSTPTGGGTQIYFNHEMCGGMPSGQIIATSHRSLTPKRWLRKGNGTPAMSGTSRLVKYYSIWPESFPRSGIVVWFWYFP